MTYIACSRGSNNNRKHFLKIPLDRATEPAMRETDKAYGIYCNDQYIWFPKSQIEAFMKRDNDHEYHVEFWCPRWLIEEKGMEIFIDTSHEPSLF